MEEVDYAAAAGFLLFTLSFQYIQTIFDNIQVYLQATSKETGETLFGAPK